MCVHINSRVRAISVISLFKMDKMKYEPSWGSTFLIAPPLHRLLELDVPQLHPVPQGLSMSSS